MYNNLLCNPCDNSNLEVKTIKNLDVRNPKIYLISVYRKKIILKMGEPVEFVKFVDVDCALYQVSCDILEAKKFRFSFMNHDYYDYTNDEVTIIGVGNGLLTVNTLRFIVQGDGHVIIRLLLVIFMTRCA